MIDKTICADFYTADKRLYNAVKDTFSWIYLVN
jgi:predicted nucleic acid-binding protein